MTGPGRQWLVPAAWLAWSLLVVWAFLPALDGPALAEKLRTLPDLETLQVPAGFPTHLLGAELEASQLATAHELLPDAEAGERKRVGLALHLISGVILLLLMLRLFRTAGHVGAAGQALAVAALWLSMPLLLSTVMHTAYLAPLTGDALGLLALLLYCEGRARPGSRLWFPAALAAALVSVTLGGELLFLVAAVMLIELLVFRFRDITVMPGRLPYAGLAVIVLILLLALLMHPGRVLQGYEFIEMSLSERIMTGAGITLDYVRQIVWLDLGRLGLYHDDVGITRGLLQVLTAAVLSLLLVLVAVAALSGRGRLVALGLSLFLVGQVAGALREPTELYLEQRNYLPSIGLLLALVALVAGLQSRMPLLRGWPVLLVVLLLGRQLVLLGSQSVIWSNDYLLHLESENRHPASQRTHMEVAYRLASDGNHAGAMRHATRGSGAKAWSPAERVMLEALLHCLAREPFPRRLFVELDTSDATLADSRGALLAAQVSRRMLSDQCAAGDAGRFVQAISAGAPAQG